MGDMSIPLQFASLLGGQEVFVWSDCLPDLGTDFLVVLSAANNSLGPSRRRFGMRR